MLVTTSKVVLKFNLKMIKRHYFVSSMGNRCYADNLLSFVCNQYILNAKIVLTIVDINYVLL